MANGQYTGWIKLTPLSGANAVFMPVAFVKKQGSVTLTNSCTPTTIPTSKGTSGSLSHCTVSHLQPRLDADERPSLSIAPRRRARR